MILIFHSLIKNECLYKVVLIDSPSGRRRQSPVITLLMRQKGTSLPLDRKIESPHSNVGILFIS